MLIFANIEMYYYGCCVAVRSSSSQSSSSRPLSAYTLLRFGFCREFFFCGCRAAPKHSSHRNLLPILYTVEGSGIRVSHIHISLAVRYRKRNGVDFYIC